MAKNNNKYSSTTEVMVVGGNPFEEADEVPIFSRRNMLLPNTSNGTIMHTTVAKNWLTCLMTTPPHRTAFMRFFLARTTPPDEIGVDKYISGYKIKNIFVDPTGHHALLPLVPESPGLSADFLYVHSNGPRLRRIEKFKDNEITAVAYNTSYGTETSTGCILLGTSKGLIFETELTQEADKPSFKRQLYDLGVGQPKYAITGLEVLHVPRSNRRIVVATTPDCIYTFQDTLKPDEKTLQPIFNSYVSGLQEPFREEQTSELNISILRFFAPEGHKFPTKWAWLCSTGLRVGEVSPDPCSKTPLLGDTFIELDFKQLMHLSYEERRFNVPKSYVITEYHALVLYADRVAVICLLNGETIQEDYFGEHAGRLQNIVRDWFTGAIYVHSEKTIFNYKITNENRNIWSIYLERGLYDQAEVHAAENPENLQTVITKHAEELFKNGNYMEAASLYADTRKAVEEMSLKFMKLSDPRPIFVYLRKRLSKLEECPETQSAIKGLIIWIIEMYMVNINLPSNDAQERQKWQAEYDEFMREPLIKHCTSVHRNDVREIIATHNDAYNLAQFAISIGDYEEVITQQLKMKNYAGALQTLREQKRPELFYEYANHIMEQLPQECVDAIIEQQRNLDPAKMMTTLCLCLNDAKAHMEQMMRFMEFAVYNQGSSDESIHNYLLRLYAEHKPKLFVDYLKNQGCDPTLVHYNVNFALTTAYDFDVKEACVFLQCLSCLWTEAVELSLTFNLQLAKETARRPADEEIQRELWLRIARHEIEDTNDVKKALNLLKECELLSIEDLLPFFSDFEKIDDFKETICEALKKYNQEIQDLQKDMEECAKQSERVRDDLNNIQEHSMRIDSQELCSICDNYLFFRPFFIFTCGHKYHSDCLEKQLLPLLSSDENRRLVLLKEDLESIVTQTVSKPDRKSEQKRLEIKAEIENILATDCLYCWHTIDTINQPFVEDWEQVNVDWQ